MPSLIRSFEYDIFISYRQKDNKGDKWVSEFVESLKTEIESTSKEEISVYFDINPQDGLLETYDVDASLQDKLKCLIFIPIISRSYCDPKSFAWEHEFKAFIKQATSDQFGLKIKLPNGNVASRLIPVQIHDLYPEDKTLVEKEIGSVLRAIEFIYKEPGVNRPLTAKDNEEKNLNKTNYRNQINKVANAIDEVFHSLKGLETATPGRKTLYSQPLPDETGWRRRKEMAGTTTISQKPKKLIIEILSVLLLTAGVFAVFKIIVNSRKNNDIAKLEKSIAVLPFMNDSPDQENTYFINGIMDEILNNLQKIKDLRVLSRTSTEQYSGINKPPIPRIAKDLDVNFILEGSGQKYGNRFRLRVQLIAAKNEKYIWGESYEKEIRETSDIFQIQSQVAQSIAKELSVSISPEEKKLIEKVATMDLTSYDLCRRGFEDLFKEIIVNPEAEKRAEDLFKKALQNDSTYALAYIGLAHVYWRKFHHKGPVIKSYLDSMLILADIALSYDNQLAEAYHVRGGYYAEKGSTEKARAEYEKAIKVNPNSWYAYSGLGWLPGSHFRSLIDNLLKACTLIRGNGLYSELNLLAMTFSEAGFPDKATYYGLNAFKLDGDSTKYLFFNADLEYRQGNYQKSIELMEKIHSKDSLFDGINRGLTLNYMYTRQFDKSLKYLERWIANDVPGFDSDDMGFIGYIYWMNGNKTKARYYFDKLIVNCKARLKIMSSDVANSATTFYNMALASLYSLLGDRENAYKNLRSVAKIQICSLSLLKQLKDCPIFDRIRNEIEFNNIVNELEARYQTEHERVRKWLEENNML